MKRSAYTKVLKTAMFASVALVAGLIVAFVFYVLAIGVPNISWNLLSTKPAIFQAT